jgi:hypothetical protein
MTVLACAQLGNEYYQDNASVSRDDSDKTLFTRKGTRQLPTQGRSGTPWIAAAMLAMIWASETQASPDQARHLADAQHAMAARKYDSIGTTGGGEFEGLPSRRASNDKSVQVAWGTENNEGLEILGRPRAVHPRQVPCSPGLR